jgi:prepilin-type N-terminal cleavage/methylation domain-containing protein
LKNKRFWYYHSNSKEKSKGSVFTFLKIRAMETKRNSGFTLVELVVTATILVILTTVWFYSYSQNLVDTRDSVRSSDIADLTSKIKLYKQSRGAVPTPASSFNILNRGIIVATQGRLSRDVALTTADTIAYDPRIDIPYTYSVTTNKQEFEVSLTLENADNPLALLSGTYKSVSKNILPTISLALDGVSIPGGVEIHDGIGAGSSNRNRFIFNNGSRSLPYTFVNPYTPYSDGNTFANNISDTSIKYWQNSDYRNCTEIYESGKSISNGVTGEEYQILSSTGALTNTGCTFL